MADIIDGLDYDLVWAIEAVSQVVDGFSCADTLPHINPYITDMKIDLSKEYDKYYDYLWSLCMTVVQQGVVEEVRAELVADDIEVYYFNEIIEDLNYQADEKAHEEVMYSVEEGDKVRLYNGNERYVVTIDGNSLWVSTKRGGPEGWHADLSDVVEILEKADEGF